MKNEHNKSQVWFSRGAPGQSIVEYTLIAVLVIGALTLAFVATGPTLGNIFSSAVLGAVGDGGSIDLTVQPDGPNAFWATVTWVASQTPEDRPFATNQPRADATDIPVDWVPPEDPEETEEPIVPQEPPTVTPSATPPDVAFELPFVDEANPRSGNEAEWYRVINHVYVGQHTWRARFYDDENPPNIPIDPFSNPNGVGYSRTYEPNVQQFISPTTNIPNMNEQYFSVRMERQLFIYGTEPVRLNFTATNATGGIRMYYRTESGTCQNFSPSSNARNTLTDNGTSPCYIVDEWRNAPAADVSGTVEFLPGPTATVPAEYTVYVEFYHTTGAPNLNVAISSPRQNPDDQGLNAASVDCNWGRYEGDRSNTRQYSWNSAVGLDEFPDNQRCYLELRGYVDLDDANTFVLNTSPVLTFWHIWDLNADTTVWLEVARYDTGVGSRPTDPSEWTTVWNPGLTSTRNYEWTQVAVDLGAAGFNKGDTVTYRFVIESNGSSGGRKRWYVDDINIGNQRTPDLTNVNPDLADRYQICEDITTCDSYWTMDGNPDDERAKFITTGRWDLTSNRARNGLAWEDDPGNRYSLEEGPGRTFDDGQRDERIYYIEFGKRIDVTNTSTNGTTWTATPTDSDGDRGAPVLTFYHSYSLKDDARLEVQYFDDVAGEWRLLRTLAMTGSTGELNRQDVHFTEVPLHLREQVNAQGKGTGVFDDATSGWTDWYQKPLRIRFAMIIDKKAEVASTGIGWSIDEILLERLGALSFTPYPLYDSAGDGDGKSVALSKNTWQGTGQWDVMANRSYGNGSYSFTDSPAGRYVPGVLSSLTLRAPLDLYADTPSNPYAPNCDASLTSTGVCEATQQTPAVNPMLTFWFNRDLANNHNIYVDIVPKGGIGTPVRVWEYIHNNRDAYQPQWERVEIALTPFLVDDGSDNFDDILISFKLDTTANGAGNATGIAIDEIRVQDEGNRPTFKLWSGVNAGNGQRYIDTIDQPTFVAGEPFNSSIITNWWERWHLGGTWRALNTTDSFAARSGLFAMHESTPLSVDPFDINSAVRYAPNSFYTLEMVRHIDLTGVSTSVAGGDPNNYRTGGTDATPVMYWWQRLDKGVNARLRVQIAYKLETPPAQLTEPLTYGADEFYGWSNWLDVYVSPQTAYREYAWVRQGVNLQNAVIYNGENGNPTGATQDFTGKIIRVRFVLDANDSVSAQNPEDGWFIDDVEFTSVKPRIYALPFADNAQSMDNWIAEGTWGIDVEHYRGSNALPPLGAENAWTAHYINCDWRPNTVNPVTARGSASNWPCSGSNMSDLLTNMDYRTVVSGRTEFANPYADSRWYMRETISNLSFDYKWASNRPTNTPSGRAWEDRFAVEYQRKITVDRAFRYVFYVRGDDGVRLGVSPFPTTAEVRAFPSTAADTNIPAGFDSYIDPATSQQISYNNILDGWRDQGPTVYQGVLTLVPNPDRSPRDYTLTLHYYESGGGAEVAFGMSSASGSFSDSPMLVPSTDRANRVPMNYLSNTSLILNGLLDLRGVNKPIWNYYTLHELGALNARAHAEISVDGGFTWISDWTLTGDIVVGGQTFEADDWIDWNWDSWVGSNIDWREMNHTLERYTGQLITMRYRLKVDSTKAQVDNAVTNVNGRWNGLNITDILIFDLQPTAQQPQIVSQPASNVLESLNADVTLSVTATGQSPLRYAWYRGTKPSDPNNPTENGAVLVASGSNTYQPPTDNIGTETYWVLVSNDFSDANPTVNPAISNTAFVTIAGCVPKDVGDCGYYRINGRDNDRTPLDGTIPDWAGDNQSASSFRPSGSNIGNTADGSITFPASSANEFVQAAMNGSAPIEVYRNVRTGRIMNWYLPVTPGQYVIRIYAPSRSSNQVPFTMTVNDDPVSYRTGASSATWSNTSINSLLGNTAGLPGVFELLPVTVTAADNELHIRMDAGSGGNRISIGGIEVYPFVESPQIIRQPADRNISSGDGATFVVGAMGTNLTFNWYRGIAGDRSNPAVGTIATNVSGNVTNSTLTLTNITQPASYWVEVFGGASGTESVMSATANISLCTPDGTPGSCNRWYINVAGEASNTPIAPDGTIWLPERDFDGAGWDSTLGANNREIENATSGNANHWSNYLAGNVDFNHAPRELFRTRSDSGNDYSWSLPVASGIYDVTLYFSDDNNDTNRRMDIIVEGVVRANGTDGTGFNMRLAVGAANTVHALTIPNVSVIDGVMNITIDRRAQNAQVAALEVVPAQ